MAHNEIRRLHQAPRTVMRLSDMGGGSTLRKPSPLDADYMEQMTGLRLSRTAQWIDRKLELSGNKTAKRSWDAAFNEFLARAQYVGEQEKNLDEDHVVLHSSDDSDASSRYLQRMGGVFLAIDVLNDVQKLSILNSVKTEVVLFTSLVRSQMLPVLASREEGIGIEDFRDLRGFLSQHTLGTFFSVALNVKSQEGLKLQVDYPVASFITAGVHSADIFPLENTERSAEDRKALKAVATSFRTISALHEMVGNAVSDPQHPDHKELSEKAREFLKNTTDIGPRVHLAVLLCGQDLLSAYRKAFNLQTGENGDIYKNVLDALRISQEKLSVRPLFIEEVTELQTGEKKDETFLKDHADVHAQVARILPNSKESTFLVDPIEVDDWGGFQVPVKVEVELDRGAPSEVCMEMAFLVGEETRKLEVALDTKKKSFDWSVLEPADAYPDLAEQLIHVTGKVLEAVGNRVDESSGGDVVLFGGGSRKKVSEEHQMHPNRRKRHNNGKMPPSPDLDSKEEPGSEKEHAEAKRRLVLKPEAIRKLTKNLSSTDRSIVLAAIDRFNLDGIGEFKKIVGVLDEEGNQVWELKTRRQSGGSGLSVLVTKQKKENSLKEKEEGDEPEQQDDNTQDFLVVKIEHRHHMQYGPLWHTRK